MRRISDDLIYRDFITVGVLLNRLRIRNSKEKGEALLKDNWIYIQEADVMVGRIQIFNNWSPYMVAIRRRCGSDWSTFALNPIHSGENGREIMRLATAELSSSDSSTPTTCSMRR